MARIRTLDDLLLAELQDQLEDGRWACPYCNQTAVPEAAYCGTAQHHIGTKLGGLVFSNRYPKFILTVVVCGACRKESLLVRKSQMRIPEIIAGLASGDSEDVTEWQRRLLPLGRNAKTFPNTPPIHLKNYRQACEIVELSPEGSACMSRRCLQGILSEQGYNQRDLVKQIEAVLRENDPKRVLAAELTNCVDAIRNFGNFGAHPITDVTMFQIIDVEPQEAEWCIEISEALMDHYFERPKLLEARLADADRKIKAAGKPGLRRTP